MKPASLCLFFWPPIKLIRKIEDLALELPDEDQTYLFRRLLENLEKGNRVPGGYYAESELLEYLLEGKFALNSQRLKLAFDFLLRCSRKSSFTAVSPLGSFVAKHFTREEALKYIQDYENDVDAMRAFLPLLSEDDQLRIIFDDQFKSAFQKTNPKVIELIKASLKREAEWPEIQEYAAFIDHLWPGNGSYKDKQKFYEIFIKEYTQPYAASIVFKALKAVYPSLKPAQQKTILKAVGELLEAHSLHSRLYQEAMIFWGAHQKTLLEEGIVLAGDAADLNTDDLESRVQNHLKNREEKTVRLWVNLASGEVFNTPADHTQACVWLKRESGYIIAPLSSLELLEAMKNGGAQKVLLGEGAFRAADVSMPSTHLSPEEKIRQARLLALLKSAYQKPSWQKIIAGTLGIAATIYLSTHQLAGVLNDLIALVRENPILPSALGLLGVLYFLRKKISGHLSRSGKTSQSSDFAAAKKN